MGPALDTYRRRGLSGGPRNGYGGSRFGFESVTYVLQLVRWNAVANLSCNWLLSWMKKGLVITGFMTAVWPISRQVCLVVGFFSLFFSFSGAMFLTF